MTFIDDCYSENTLNQIESSSNEVVMLENVRFYAEEEGSKKVDGKKIKSDP